MRVDVIILAKNPLFALRVLSEAHLITQACEIRRHVIVVTDTGPHLEDVWRQFHTLERSIHSVLQDGFQIGKQSTIIATDLNGYGRTSARRLFASHGSGWPPVLALLILAFPEVVWLLRDTTAAWALAAPSDFPVSLADGGLGISVKLLTQGATPLFGMNPLREQIKSWAAERSESAWPAPIPRSLVAAIVEDERPFCFFLGYVAYRASYRCHTVWTLSRMLELFGPVSVSKKDGPLSLVLEDQYLNFPDGHPDEFSSQASRNELCPGLASAKRRVRMSSGDIKGGANPSSELQKPFRGIFQIAHHLDLNLQPQSSNDSGREDSQGHSAPGRALEVARYLLDKAKRGISSGADVESSIYCAVLAEESLALSRQTPISAIEALAVRHQLEAQAETHFLGVAGVVETDRRLECLAADVDELVTKFAEPEQRQASLNTQIAIIRQLIKIFKESCRFDEELALQAKERELVREVWYKEASSWKAFGERRKIPNWIVQFACRPLVELLNILAIYAHFAISSLGNLAAATILSILLLTATFLLTSTPHHGETIGLGTGLYMAITSSVGVGLPAFGAHTEEVHYPLWAVALAMLSGVFHFALGASFAYTRLIRR